MRTRHVSPLKAALAFGILSSTIVLGAGGALANGPSPQAELVGIHADWDACREATEDAVELQICDSAAMGAADDLVARRHHRLLSSLLQEMFESLVYGQGDGEDSLGGRVVVTSSYAELAQRRAEILLAVRPVLDPPEGAARSPHFALAGLSDRRAARQFEVRWLALRNADCAAYRVARCPERLDAAFARMIDASLISD